MSLCPDLFLSLVCISLTYWIVFFLKTLYFPSLQLSISFVRVGVFVLWLMAAARVFVESMHVIGEWSPDIKVLVRPLEYLAG